MHNSLEQVDRSGDGSSPRVAGGHEVAGYLNALRRGWKIVIPVSLLTVAASWYSMQNEVPQYTAEVLVQLAQAPNPTIDGLLGAPDYASQVDLIRSRSVLGPSIDSLGYRISLYERDPDRTDILQGVEFDDPQIRGNYLLAAAGNGTVLLDGATSEQIDRSAAGGWLEGPGFRLRINHEAIGEEPIRIGIADVETAVERLRRRLLVEPGTSFTLIKIQYSDPDPVFAAAVANAAASGYESFRAGAGRQAASLRKEFLHERLLEITDSLERVQQHFLDYQQSQGSLDPRMEGSAMMGELMQAQNEVRVLQHQERLLQDLVGSLTTSPDGLHRLIALGDDGVLPGGAQLYERIQGLNAERSNLTASRFGQTARGPEVEVIDTLLAQTWQDVRALASGALSVRQAQIRETQAYIDQLRSSVGAMPERSAEFGRLGQQVQAVQSIFDNLLSGYYEAQIAEAVETGDVRIVDPAAVPLWPQSSNFGLNIGIAALVGLMLGAGGVVIRHHFDSRVQRVEQAERSADLQTIGMIPHFNGRSRTELQSAGVEAFRWLATNLNFFDSDKPLVVAVTSAAPGEGKSTVAVNLALSSAASGRRVLLVDSDFRRPVVHGLLKAQRGPGLSDVLKGEVHPVAAIRTVEAWGVDVMTCGSPIEDPTRLLSGDAFDELVDRLRRHYDLVIVDTAPVLAVAESMIVCSKVNGVLFAVRANQTDQREILEATNKIRRMNGTLIGLVITDVPTGNSFDRESYRYYDYGYYGNADEGKSEKRLLAGLVGGGRT